MAGSSLETKVVLPPIMNPSRARAKRWDETFVLEALLNQTTFLEDTDDTPKDRKIARVWVCGPPAMNEELDKALRKLAPQFGLNTLTDVDIM